MQYSNNSEGQGLVVETPKDWKLLKLNNIIVDIIDYRGKTPKELGGGWSESGIMRSRQ